MLYVMFEIDAWLTQDAPCDICFLFFLFQLNAREDKFDRLAGALVEKVRESRRWF